jgi:Lipase (class 3)
MASIFSALVDIPFAPWKAAILARACQIAYNPTSLPNSTNIDTFRQAVNAASAAPVAQNNLTPGYVVYRLNPGGFIVSFAGCTSFRQFLSYWMFSDAVGGAYAAGSTSRFLQTIYNGIRAPLLAAMNQAAGGTGIPVLICGHSAGGGLAQMLCADLIGQFPAQYDVRSVYLFGSPRAGDRVFYLSLPNGRIFNIRRDSDPVVNWPSDQVRQVLSLLTSGGAVSSVVEGQFNYITPGTLFRLESTEICPVSSFRGLSFDDLRDCIGRLHDQTALPDIHKIEAYADSLLQVASFHLGRKLSGIRDVVDAVRALPAPPQPLESIIPGGTLPALRPGPTLPPPPPGGRTAISTQVLRVGGRAMSVIFDTKHKSKRAQPGDGRAKRCVRKMLHCMDYIDWHDGAVVTGKRKSTQVVKNPAWFGSAELAAWDGLYAFLANLSEGL